MKQRKKKKRTSPGEQRRRDRTKREQQRRRRRRWRASTRREPGEQTRCRGRRRLPRQGAGQWHASFSAGEKGLSGCKRWTRGEKRVSSTTRERKIVSTEKEQEQERASKKKKLSKKKLKKTHNFFPCLYHLALFLPSFQNFY